MENRRATAILAMSLGLGLALAIGAPGARAEGPSAGTGAGAGSGSGSGGNSSSSSGPASSAEARILRDDGTKAYRAGKFQDAVNALGRYVDRYPGEKDYLEAHRMLGIALLRLGRAEDAIAPLEYFVQARSSQRDGLATRVWLARAYLKLGKFDEAFLTAGEIEKQRKLASPASFAQALLLKSWALIGLGQDDRAQEVAASAEKLAPISEKAELKGELARIELRIKLRECARFPSSAVLDEGQARDQLNRRGSCLSEALLVGKRAADSGDDSSARLAADELKRAVGDYKSACLNPPEPPAIHPEDRTEEQKKKYRLELTELLRRECRAKLDESKKLVADWNNPISRSLLPELGAGS